MTNQLLITIALPVFLAFVSGGGLVGLLNFLANRPESLAKAKQINVTAELSLSEGWRQYAEGIQKKLEDFELKYDAAILSKDKTIERLTKRVADLEIELSRYKGTEGRIEFAREAIHEQVDRNIDNVHQS